jgi:hypothetical protein
MLIDRLDALHRRLRANPLAWRLVVGTRILLAAGFLPTGTIKMLGRPFTTVDTATPIGLFFHAMHQTGLYWQFLGATQVVASILLLIPAAAHLGALAFLPVMVNIFVVTISMDFRGTPVVTGLMLLACLLLVVWDYHRWRGILTLRTGPPVPEPMRLTALERGAFAAGAVFGMLFFLGTRGLAPRPAMFPALVASGVAIIVVLFAAARRPWRRASYPPGRESPRSRKVTT